MTEPGDPSNRHVAQKPRKRTDQVEISDLTLFVRVPGQPDALRVFTDEEADEASAYAAATGGSIVALPLAPPAGRAATTRVADSPSSLLVMPNIRGGRPPLRPNTLAIEYSPHEPAGPMLTLRDYQLAAVDAVTPDDTRALLVSGCGTGKTLMALHAVAKLIAGAPATVLLTFPTLGLLEQTYQVWRAEAPMPFSALAVCSQQISEAEDIADDELSMPSTTSAEQLAHWLTETPGVRVVFATYQSAAVLAAAHTSFGAPDWTVMVCDFSSRIHPVRHVRQRGEIRLCHTSRRYCSRHPMRGTGSGRVEGGGCARERWSTSSRPRTIRTIRRASLYSTPAPPRSTLAATAG